MLSALRQNPNLERKVDVPQERQFVGFDAYNQVINSGVDVVLLCTPPHSQAHTLRTVGAYSLLFTMLFSHP